MSGNTFGTLFKVTTWGESHGKALGCIIDGCPANFSLNEKQLQHEVDRRKPKTKSLISTTRKEKDKVEILSGVFEGKTLGTPISIMVENKDKRSKDYSKIKNTYRPGHADIAYDLKYGFRDYRGGGRSSGRETVSRVMAGAVAKQILSKNTKTDIFGHTVQVGDIKAKRFTRSQIEKNELRCADSSAVKDMLKLIKKVRLNEGDSIGAIIEIVIKNPPIGLGQPVFDKLDANLTKAIMSIGAIKGIEIGIGFNAASTLGSDCNDQITIKSKKVHFLSNNAGGTLGGISTGQDIVIRAAVKPVPSISKQLQSITKNHKKTKIMTLGRHDTCLAPRIIPVAEAMPVITLLDHYLIQTGYSNL